MSPCEQAIQQALQQYNAGLANILSELQNQGRLKRERLQFLANSVAHSDNATSLSYVPQTSGDIVVTFIKAIVTSTGTLNLNGPDGPFSFGVSPGDPDHRFGSGGEDGLLVRYSDPITLTQSLAGSITLIVIGFEVPRVGVLYG